MKKLTDDFLRPFSAPQVALLHTLAMEMETYGLTASDVIDICDQRLTEARSPREAPEQQPIPTKQKKRRKPRLSSIKCPECGDYVEITPVNISRCTNIGGPWKSSLICSRHECRWTELSEKSVMEWNNVDINA